MRISTRQRCTSLGCRRQIKCLASVRYLSFLTTSSWARFLFCRSRKRTRSLDYHCHRSLKRQRSYSPVLLNKSTRQNHCLSIEYPPKRNMSTGTTPTILQSTFLGGSAAVFAVNFTHPIELVKSRVQVNNMGVIQTCTDTLKNEGIAAFWKVRENSGVLEFLCPWIGTSKKCSPFAIFLLVLSFSIPF